MINPNHVYLTCLSSRDEYYAHARENAEQYEARRNVLDQIVSAKPTSSMKNRQCWSVDGYSYAGLCSTLFDACLEHGSSNINWRESLVCQATQTNNRQRAALHFFDLKCSPTITDLIYVSEQLTPFYRALKKRYPNTIGSEFLAENMNSGSINRDGIRHEDFTQLSFDNESVDHIISLDCLEHIPDYLQGFREAARVLRSGGNLVATFPFDVNSVDNLIRAEVDENGKIIHHLPPEYHGDPVKEEGILCYQVLGWHVLEQLIDTGFSRANLYLMWSRKYGYLGPDQVLILGQK